MRKTLFYSLFVLVGTVACACAAPSTKATAAAAAAQPSPVFSAPRANSDGRPEVEATQIAFAVGISSMMPVGEATSFDDSVRQVYFWNRLRVRHPPAKIKHVWYVNDQKSGEYDLEARYPKVRVWSHKAVAPGLWKVEVVDDAGNTVVTGAFVVRKAAPAVSSAPKPDETKIKMHEVPQ